MSVQPSKEEIRASMEETLAYVKARQRGLPLNYTSIDEVANTGIGATVILEERQRAALQMLHQLEKQLEADELAAARNESEQIKNAQKTLESAQQIGEGLQSAVANAQEELQRRHAQRENLAKRVAAITTQANQATREEPWKEGMMWSARTVTLNYSSGGKP